MEPSAGIRAAAFATLMMVLSGFLALCIMALIVLSAHVGVGAWLGGAAALAVVWWAVWYLYRADLLAARADGFCSGSRSDA